MITLKITRSTYGRSLLSSWIDTFINMINLEKCQCTRIARSSFNASFFTASIVTLAFSDGKDQEEQRLLPERDPRDFSTQIQCDKIGHYNHQKFTCMQRYFNKDSDLFLSEYLWTCVNLRRVRQQLSPHFPHLPPVVKVLERLLHLEINLPPLSPTQHDFRPNHSTFSVRLTVTNLCVNDWCFFINPCILQLFSIYSMFIQCIQWFCKRYKKVQLLLLDVKLLWGKSFAQLLLSTCYILFIH